MLKKTKILIILLLSLFLYGCGDKRIVFEPRQEAMSSVKAMLVVDTARKQIGKRYRYGGETPGKGFDCSGLLWWSFRQHGIQIPRVSKDQARFGKAVSLSSLRAGDILIFRIKSGLHTALYAGNSNFVHSPSSGKRVRQDKLDSYWKPKLQSARRVGAISAPR